MYDMLDLFPFAYDRRSRVLSEIRRHGRSKFDVLEDTAHFPRGLDRGGQLLIELRCVPVHLGERQNILRQGDERAVMSNIPTNSGNGGTVSPKLSRTRERKRSKTMKGRST
jgi:hypothetical protein